MTRSAIVELFERLGRLVAATRRKAGEGTSWEYTFPDGETHRYDIRGLRSPAEIEDDACNLIIWIWNARDYLKERAAANGLERQIVDDAVATEPDLAACADLAERLKHGRRDRKPRSGHDLRLGRIFFEAPQAALASLTFGPAQVEMDFANPDLVVFRLPVLDETEAPFADAFDLAARAIAALERLRTRIEGASLADGASTPPPIDRPAE